MRPTARQAERRYVGLTALRWLPIGISAPVTVLLMTSRGLSPADIGLVLTVYGFVTLVLELPTGGLADALGHRPVLVLSGLLGIASMLLMVVADGLALFAVAWAVQGMSRALDSGPLEAWFVDTVHLADPDADVTPGLSRAGAADGLGLSFGAVVGGLLPLLVGDDDGAFATPLLIASAMTLVSLVCVVLLVEPLATSHRSGAAAVRAGVREMPRVVRATAVLVARNRLLRLLWVISFLTGTVLTTMELLGPLQFAALSGGLAQGSAVYGIVMAVSFAAAGVGALLAPRARRLARGSVAWASVAFALLGTGAVVGVALAPGVVLAAVAYALFYLFNGGGWPLRQQLVHEQTTSSQRSTTVSAKSLALMLGGMLGSLLVPRLAEAAGYPVGFLAGAAALLLIAAVSVGLRPAGTAARAARQVGATASG